MLDRKIRYCSLPEAIREHFLWGARSIVIAGTHGKTTTTSLTGWLLTHGGARSRACWSAASRGTSASTARAIGSASGRDFVIEGDEYDSAFFDKTAKFLKYLPDIAVVNNVEFDHADIYADLDAVTLAFRRLVNLVPRRGLLLLGADSPRRAALTAAAVSRVRDVRHRATDVDWQAHDLEPAGAATQVQGPPARVAVRQLRGAARRRAQRPQRAGGDRRRDRGRRRRRADRRRAARALPASSGGSRSSASADGVTVYDDFAHHPTAVAETLARPARGESRGAHLGGVRAALGFVVPARVPGRLRARVRRRRRSAHRAGVPLDAAGGRAAVGPQLVRDLEGRGPVGARSRRRSTTSSRRSSASTARRSRRADVERRIRRHPPEAAAGARRA